MNNIEDLLLFFLWYCMNDADMAYNMAYDITHTGHWQEFDLAIRAVTLMARKNKMSPYLYLYLYRLSYEKFYDREPKTTQ